MRRAYEDAAQEMLAVPGDALAAERFDVVAQHFDRADTSAASSATAAAVQTRQTVTFLVTGL